MSAPKVRLHDMDVVEVWTGGKWEQAEVEDFRTLVMEFDVNFALAVSETPLCEAECYGTHSCDETYCDGWKCDDCGYVCDGDDITGTPV